MTAVALTLPPEQEKAFDEWVAQRDPGFQRDAGYLLAMGRDSAPSRSGIGALGPLVVKALMLTRPLLDDRVNAESAGAQYLLTLLQTIVALHHRNGGRPYTWSEVAGRSSVHDAAALYELRVVSLGAAARIAGLSHSSMIEALGKAGIAVFQYDADEVIADAAAA